MGIAISGITAAGHVPVYLIPAATVTTPPTETAKTLTLTALTGDGTVKADCYMDAGDFTVNRAATTKERQRLCQKVSETIKTGETIDLTLSAVYDQQADPTDAVNLVYSALTEGAELYVGIPYGWDTDETPTAETKLDLYAVTVQMVTKNFPTSIDEDLKITATLSGSAYWSDVALTA